MIELLDDTELYVARAHTRARHQAKLADLKGEILRLNMLLDQIRRERVEEDGPTDPWEDGGGEGHPRRQPGNDQITIPPDFNESWELRPAEQSSTGPEK